MKPYTTAEEHTEYTMYHTQTDRTTKPPYTVMVKVNQVNLRMEIDTGATFSIISKKTYDSLWPKTRAPKLESTEVPLYLYTSADQGTKDHQRQCHIPGKATISQPHSCRWRWTKPTRKGLVASHFAGLEADQSR